MSDFKKEGSLAWHFGVLLCTIGFAYMFEKDERNTIEKALKWVEENLPNNAPTRPASAVGMLGESDESADG